MKNGGKQRGRAVPEDLVHLQVEAEPSSSPLQEEEQPDLLTREPAEETLMVSLERGDLVTWSFLNFTVPPPF